jgi:endonuclease/exonuclease/phosphatase family metal-dependent hydrolase
VIDRRTSRNPSLHPRRLVLVALAILVPLSLPLLFGGCGDAETTMLAPPDANRFSAFAVGSDTTLELVTWNLRNFATDAGGDEVALAAEAILGLGADVVALQEIAQAVRFDQLLEALPGYRGYQARTDNFQNLAYVWLDSTVTVDAVFELFPGEWRPFPRQPLVLEITWRGREFVLVNNHLKCCGNGQLDLADPDDEETRRLDAVTMLEQWMAAERADAAVVVLGDLNDWLTDPEAHNVFQPWLAQPEAYRFTDLAVAAGPADGWSWGPGRGHLDHILVTDELFAAAEAPGADCRTLRLDRALDGGTFTGDLSDHAPVVLVLPESALPAP